MSTTIASLLTGGSPFLKWETPGTAYTGTITDITARQARKYESTDLDFWDDGTPKMQILVTLDTAYRDDKIEDDDGTRTLSINAWSGQKKALAAACRAAGVSEPLIGQTLTVTHTGGIGNAKSPREFTYVLGPVPTGVAAALAAPEPEPVQEAIPAAQPAAPAPAVTAPVAAAPVASAPAPAATPAANPAEAAKDLLRAGLSVPDVATAVGLPATTVQALAGLL